MIRIHSPGLICFGLASILGQSKETQATVPSVLTVQTAVVAGPGEILPNQGNAIQDSTITPYQAKLVLEGFHSITSVQSNGRPVHSKPGSETHYVLHLSRPTAVVRVAVNFKETGETQTKTATFLASDDQTYSFENPDRPQSVNGGGRTPHGNPQMPRRHRGYHGHSPREHGHTPGQHHAILGKLADYRTQLGDVERELARARAEHGRIEAAIATRQNERSTIEARIAGLKQEQERTNLNQTTAQNEFDTARSRRESEHAESLEATDNFNEWNATLKRISELANQNGNAQALLPVINEQWRAFQNERDAQQKQFEEADRVFRRKKAQLEDVNAEVERIEQDIETAKKELLEARNALILAGHDRDVAHDKVVPLERQVIEITAKIAVLSDVLSDLQTP